MQYKGKFVQKGDCSSLVYDSDIYTAYTAHQISVVVYAVNAGINFIPPPPPRRRLEWGKNPPPGTIIVYKNPPLGTKQGVKSPTPGT